MNNSNELKITFNNIKYLRESVYNLLNSLKDKVSILNNIYKDLLTNNLHDTMNGLDSLHFQSKLINYEIENNNNIFRMIDNHIYCNYYKLYKSVLKYLEDNIKITNITSTFSNKEYPVYKDLDLKSHYDFNMSIEIYNTIIQILNILNTEYMSREHKLSLETNIKKSGLNIDNLINSLQYNNNTMKNNIHLYHEYLIIFNDFHSKYLTRFSLRTKLLYGQINNDIHLEESKTNINCSLNDENVVLENEEENNIRNCIESCSNNKYNNNLQNKELDNIISNITVTPQISSSSVESPTNLLNKNIDIDISNNFSFISSSIDISNKIIDFVKHNNKKLKKKNLEKDNDIEYNLNNCIIL